MPAISQLRGVTPIRLRQPISSEDASIGNFEPTRIDLTTQTGPKSTGILTRSYTLQDPPAETALPQIRPRKSKEANARQFKRWYEKNADRVSERMKKYNDEHPQEVKQRFANWYEQNAEGVRERMRHNYHMKRSASNGNLTVFLTHSAGSHLEEDEIIRRIKESPALMEAVDKAYGANSEERVNTVLHSLIFMRRGGKPR